MAYLIFQCVKMVGWFVGLVIGIVVTAEKQRRIGGGERYRYRTGLLVLLDGLLEGVVLVYVHSPIQIQLLPQFGFSKGVVVVG